MTTYQELLDRVREEAEEPNETFKEKSYWYSREYWDDVLVNPRARFYDEDYDVRVTEWKQFPLRERLYMVLDSYCSATDFAFVWRVVLSEPKLWNLRPEINEESIEAYTLETFARRTLFHEAIMDLDPSFRKFVENNVTELGRFRFRSQ